MYDARKGVRSFMIGTDDYTGISLGKQRTTPGEVHLVIGLGGAGTDMLLKTKGMINKYCCSDNDQNSAPGRVAYLAFDSDGKIGETTSSSETGQVRLSEEEAVLFCRRRMAEVNDLGSNPYISEWFDKEIYVDYQGSGSGAYRQVGRMLLFLDIDTVVAKISDAVRGLIGSELNRGGWIDSFVIDILTGLSGGTGGGTFLDMAYIAGQIAEKELWLAGIGEVKPKICGYFLSPDAALLKADQMTAQLFLKNGGEALQELEKAMQRGRRGESYLCRYSDTFSVYTEKAPFDFVYLISPDRYLGSYDYKNCIDIAANSLLSSVTYADRAEAARAHVQHSAMQGMPYQMNPVTDFTYCYTGLSYTGVEILPDLITKSIFTAVFEEFNDDRFFTEPSQEDADKVFRYLGLSLGQMMEPVKRYIWKPLDTDQFTANELFGTDPVDLREFLPPENYIRARLEQEFSYNALHEVESRLEILVRESFKDPRKGPHWTNHLLLGFNAQGYIGLRELVLREKYRAETAHLDLGQEVAHLQGRIDEYLRRARGSLLFRIVPSRRKEYVEMWNEYALRKAQLMNLEILTARRTGFYDRVLYLIEKMEGEWVKAGCEVFDGSRWVTESNIETLRNLEDKNKQRPFRWDEGIIPVPYSVFRQEFTNRAVNTKEMADDFLDKLYEMYKYDRRDPHTAPYDYSKLFTAFLDRWAGNLFRIPLERIIGGYFGVNNPLNVSVETELLPYLAQKARRQLDVGEGGIYGEMVIVPSKYHDNGINAANAIRVPRNSLIDVGAENYCLNRQGPGRSFDVLSSLRYRIGVVSWRFGMALSDLDVYKRCEEAMKR